MTAALPLPAGVVEDLCHALDGTPVVRAYLGRAHIDEADVEFDTDQLSLELENLPREESDVTLDVIRPFLQAILPALAGGKGRGLLINVPSKQTLDQVRATGTVIYEREGTR